MQHIPDQNRDRATEAALAPVLLELLGAASTESFALVGRDGALRWYNQRFALLFGDPEQALEREPALHLLVTPPHEEPRSGRIITSAGRHVEWSAVAIDDAHGGGQLFRFLDRTDELSLRRMIEEQGGRLRLLSAQTEGIIFELDAEARFVRVWASDPALLARPESELIGRTLIEALGPELGVWHDEKVRRILLTGIAEEYEYTMNVPRGRRTFVASNVVVPSVERDERAVIYWIRDVTEATQLRLKLLQAERLASVGMLAAGVAHEINNPLGYMLLNIGQVRSGITALGGQVEPASLDALRSVCEMLHQGAERVRKIVDDLRTFSRPDDVLRPTNVHRAIEFAIELTNAEIAHRARVVLHFGELPLVKGNEGRLGQLFINLICNAAQAIVHGAPDDNEIRIATRIGPNGAAVIEVSDTGKGIPVEILDRIFDPFFTTKETGTGLGLSICHTIVTGMDGQIEVEPRSPRGTTFRVRFPPAS